MLDTPAKNSARSRSSVIDGVPFVVATFSLIEEEDFAKSVIAYILEVGNAALVDEISDHPEWSHLSADAVRLVWDGDGFTFQVKNSSWREVNRLEYGTPTSPPSAILRPLLVRMEDAFKHVGDAAIKESVENGS